MYISQTAEPNLVAGGNQTDLHWESELIEEGATIRAEITGMHFDSECHFEKANGEVENVEEKSERDLMPRIGPIRQKAVAPPEVAFDAGAGRLQGPGAGKTREDKLEGELKVLGYDEQSVINSKIG